MTPLTDILRQTIKTDGALSVARYMELALQHPTYGYYQSGDRLGAQGDFTTAPEISQMFGELLGLWCVEAWRALGSPQDFTLLELGPGRGTLMYDALRATSKITSFQSALHLHFLETNETFKELQLQKLSSRHPTYIDTLEALPEKPLIVIANEFFDVLPIHQLLRKDGQWGERKVGLDGEALAFIDDVDDAEVIETSPLALAFMDKLARHISMYQGALLAIDYGYAAPSGQGTLQAVSHHRFADPLEAPGTYDLTAHVDFGALRSRAESQGASVLGPTEQGSFLRALGIDVRAAMLKHAATDVQKSDIDLAVDRLTSDAQMGTLFKVMAVTDKTYDLPGF